MKVGAGGQGPNGEMDWAVGYQTDRGGGRRRGRVVDGNSWSRARAERNKRKGERGMKATREEGGRGERNVDGGSHPVYPPKRAPHTRPRSAAIYSFVNPLASHYTLHNPSPRLIFQIET